MTGILATWLILLALLLAEWAAVAGPGWSALAPFIGIGMALVVVFRFMRLRQGPALHRVFALAGLFWLCVLLGLGSLDALTRHDIPVPRQTIQAGPGFAPETAP